MTIMKRRLNHEEGFTLVELMFVVAILGIITIIIFEFLSMTWAVQKRNEIQVDLQREARAFMTFLTKDIRRTIKPPTIDGNDEITLDMDTTGDGKVDTTARYFEVGNRISYTRRTAPDGTAPGGQIIFQKTFARKAEIIVEELEFKFVTEEGEDNKRRIHVTIRLSQIMGSMQKSIEYELENEIYRRVEIE